MILMPQQSLCYLSIEVEDGEEDCDDTIRDDYLEKPTSTQLRSVIQTLLDFSFLCSRVSQVRLKFFFRSRGGSTYRE